MIVVPFEPEHLETLMLQPSQSHFSNLFDSAYGPALAQAGPCFTGIADGEIVACSGVVKQWDNRATAWALISENAGKHFVKIHKAVKRFLDLSDIRRIEAYADVGFDQGHRWLHMLGFEREGYMRCYSPNGNDAVLYARIK